MPPPVSSVRRLRNQAGLCLHRWRTDPVRRFVTSSQGGFACFGTTARTGYFIRHYLGIEAPEAYTLTRRWNPWHTAAAARRAARDQGLVVFTETSAPVALRSELLSFDTYVDLEIPLPADEATFVRHLSASARSDIRRSRRFEAKVSHDPAWATEFHQRHHLPSIRDRHGDEGFVASPEELARVFAGGKAEWIQVMTGAECVGALLGEPGPEGYGVYRLGWRDGDPAWLPAGVVGALYWFGVRRAFALGLPRVHLGGVMSDLEDGLFRYKAKWGARLIPDDRRYRRLLLLLDPTHPHARRFLAPRALLARDAAGDLIVLSGRAPAEVPAAREQAPFLRAWFRLRETPDAAPSAAKAALPPSLRPWFDATPLTNGG